MRNQCDNRYMTEHRKLTPAETRALIAHANNRKRPPQLAKPINTRADAKQNEIAKARIGRPAKPINWMLAAAICGRMAEGELLADICKSQGMPKASTVRDWALYDDEFAAMFERARSIGCEANAEELEHWAADRPADNVEAQWQRTRIDTRKWLLSKYLPRKFGDTRTVDHSGGIALQVTTGVPLNSGEVADGLRNLSDNPDNPQKLLAATGEHDSDGAPDDSGEHSEVDRKLDSGGL